MNIGISIKVPSMVKGQLGPIAPVLPQTNHLLINNTDKLLINGAGDFLRTM